MGLVNPLVLRVSGAAGEMTATCSASGSVGCIVARTSAALSRTEGTDCSSCSEAFARAMKWGLVTWVAECGEVGAVLSGSISRSKMADDDECIDVGDEGISEGDFEP